MREIKFRAWDIEFCEMCYPELITWGSDSRIIDFEGNRDSGGAAVLEEGEFDLMQFTGLKDKNGREIYEGDILDLNSTVNGVNLFEVYYRELQARFSIKYYTSRMPKRSLEYEYSVSDFFKPCEISGEVDFEVIGNIYENKELLK